jgi:penicillin-binding protein 1C
MRTAGVVGLAAALAVALAVGALGGFTPDGLLVNRAGFSQAVFDRDGHLLRLTLTSDEKYRLWVPLAEMSPDLVRATLLQEDRHFFRHPGVNPFSLARAAWSTWVGGGRRIGGSTLTMQLARLRFGIDSSTPTGKLEQILRALQLERRFTKQEILEAYLNLAPYGGNVEGVGAASLVYFGKQASDLDLREALTLSVIPQSPTARAPRSPAALARLAGARARLFDDWQADAGGAVPAGRGALEVEARRREELPFRAPHLVTRVVAEHPHEGRIVTTLDLRLQALVERQLARFVAGHRRLGIRNGSVLLVEHRTMEVKAYAGSADFRDPAIDGQVDGLRARRSPGSALKPFIYALALDQGLINPLTVLKDASLTVSSYNPENFDREFLGPVNATDALVRSRNLPALQLASQLHDPDLYDFLRRAGVHRLRPRGDYGLALALGGVEVRPDDLARLYALLANGGVLRPLVLVDGAAHEPPPEDGPRLLSPEASRLVLEMLRQNPRPNDLRGASPVHDQRVPWKTGTSWGFRDAWAAGVVGPYVLVVWIGNFDGDPNPAFVGRDAAGPLFFDIVDALGVEERAPETMPADLHLVRVEVCALSGYLPGPHCRQRRSTWFIPGVSPIETCPIHRDVAIDAETGLRACPGQAEPVRREVYEFWPSDLLALSRAAGIARRTPPPFHPRCPAASPRGMAPVISSPQPRLEYAARGGAPFDVPFRAVTEADSRRVYWFVDDTFAGVSASGAPLLWRARAGRYTVRAVDEQGRSAATEFRVVVAER